MAKMSGIFDAAVMRQRELQAWVTQRQTEAISKADAMRQTAVGGIDAMARMVGGLHPTVALPKPPELALQVDGLMDLPDLGKDSFGTVTPVNRGDFSAGTVAALPPIDIEDFEPGLQAIIVREAPEPREPGPLPDKPALGAIVLPAKPQLDRPLLPSLATISIPDFEFPTLPAFTAVPPEFEGTAVSSVLQWSETPYQVEVLDEVLVQLRAMWAGGTGLPPVVERALWERAASREDLAVERDVSAAATEFSARGFTMPPGMLANRIDAIRSDAQLRKLALGREVLIKIADTHIENLRFACTQALAAEQVLVGIWSAMAQREFEAAKVQLDSQLALLNAQVAIYNARQSAYQTEATVYRARLDAALASIQLYRAQLDGEIAKGQINEQRVRVYGEQIKALLADLEIYKTEMSGAQIQAELQRNAIEVFKAEVSAYAELLQADKVRFEGRPQI